MSTSRSVLRISSELAAAGSSRSTRRSLASKAGSSSSASTGPTVYASLLLSRPPLITPTPTQLESTYYQYNASIQHALSNPPAQTNPFYFKSGSLPSRRFQQTQYQYLTETYGSELAGSAPDLGDVPAESPVTPFARDHWEKQDSKRGEKSLERLPDQEVFCIVKSSEGKWEVPRVRLENGENLDDAIARIRGVGGMMDGEKMDSWLVTRKPIGSVESGSETVRSALNISLLHVRVAATDFVDLLPALTYSGWRAKAWQGHTIFRLGMVDSSRGGREIEEPRG